MRVETQVRNRYHSVPNTRTGFIEYQHINVPYNSAQVGIYGVYARGELFDLSTRAIW